MLRKTYKEVKEKVNKCKALVLNGPPSSKKKHAKKARSSCHVPKIISIPNFRYKADNTYLSRPSAVHGSLFQ